MVSDLSRFKAMPFKAWFHVQLLHAVIACNLIFVICCRTVPVGPDQLLLRGAMLRNTRWIFGISRYCLLILC